MEWTIFSIVILITLPAIWQALNALADAVAALLPPRS